MARQVVEGVITGQHKSPHRGFSVEFSEHREYAPGRTWDSLCHGLLHFADFGRCVDVGAGDGAMVELIAPRSSALICVDPSPAMVAAGRSRVQALHISGVEYLQAPGEELPPLVIHNERAKQELGFRPRPADETIIETVESLRDLGLLG